MANEKMLFRSRYHLSYYLLIILVGLLLYRSYLEIAEYFLQLEVDPGIPFYRGLSFSLLFIPLILYGVIFFLKTTKQITITTAGIKFGGNFIDRNDIEGVEYLRKDFRFLVAVQKQQAVVVTLKNGVNITIWCEHYRNGRQIKKLIESISAKQAHQ